MYTKGKIILSPLLIISANLLITISAANLNNQENVRISDGKLATKGQFPWHALIFIEKFGMGGGIIPEICGGALIEKDVILTSAGCLFPPNVLLPFINITRVVLGSVNLEAGGEDDTDRYETSAVGHVLWDYYDPFDFYGDVGLVFIEDGLVLNDNIQTIDISPDFVEENVTLAFSGFGSENITWGGVTDHLHYRDDLVTFSQDECEEMSGAFYYDDNLCTTGGVTPGDGGSPLVANFPDNPVYVGSSKFLVGDNVVHTRISSYYDWIKAKIAEFRKKKAQKP